VAFPIPSRAASSREDQCVTPSFFGGGFNVSVTILAWSIDRGRPDRSASARPAIPLRSYRCRQAITFGRESPTCSAISVFDTPSEASSTTRARCARPARIDVLRVIEASRSRSPSRSPKAAAGRFGISQF
jgi:hypothetical protein